jgi:hypothetical protein
VVPDTESLKKLGRAVAEKTVRESRVNGRYLLAFQEQASALDWEEIIKSGYGIISTLSETTESKKTKPSEPK